MDVISVIEEELGIKANIDFKKIQPGDVKETYANIDYSKEKIGYKPDTSIKSGIPKFINWYREYYNA